MIDVHRYPVALKVTTSLNPLEDVMCWIAGLKSRRYLKEIAQEKHPVSGLVSLDDRIDEAAACIEIACEYLEQAFRGPQTVSFLSLYYAFLNLAKVYVILGPFVIELKRQRRHGVTYDPSLKESRSLETEYIRVRPEGVVPLFYRTLTGSTKIKPRFRVSDIYPFILDISAEYRVAMGQLTKLVPFRLQLGKYRDGKQRLQAEQLRVEEPTAVMSYPDTLRCLKAFKGMRKDPGNPGIIISPEIPEGAEQRARDFIRPSLLYGMAVGEQRVTLQFVPVCGSSTLLPEELPILLAFFHMSSIVRYNPQFYRRLVDSKYWPLVLTLRRHGTYKFLLLFWSFINQASYYLRHT